MPLRGHAVGASGVTAVVVRELVAQDERELLVEEEFLARELARIERLRQRQETARGADHRLSAL